MNGKGFTAVTALFTWSGILSTDAFLSICFRNFPLSFWLGGSVTFLSFYAILTVFRAWQTAIGRFGDKLLWWRKPVGADEEYSFQHLKLSEASFTDLERTNDLPGRTRELRTNEELPRSPLPMKLFFVCLFPDLKSWSEASWSTRIKPFYVDQYCKHLFSEKKEDR